MVVRITKANSRNDFSLLIFIFADTPRMVVIGADETAQLASPSFPQGDLPSTFEITWIIETGTDRKIIVTFPDSPRLLSTEHFLRAGDGSPTTDQFFQWRDNSAPPRLISAENKMWLQFTSDGKTSTRASDFSGFSLKAQSVPSTGKTPYQFIQSQIPNCS